MKVIAALVLVMVLLVTVCAAGCTSPTTDQSTATLILHTVAPIPSGGQSTGDDRSTQQALGVKFMIHPFNL